MSIFWLFCNLKINCHSTFFHIEKFLKHQKTHPLGLFLSFWVATEIPNQITLYFAIQIIFRSNWLEPFLLCRKKEMRLVDNVCEMTCWNHFAIIWQINCQNLFKTWDFTYEFTCFGLEIHIWTHSHLAQAVNTSPYLSIYWLKCLLCNSSIIFYQL